MCGIVGIISPREQVNKHALQKAVNSLYHRGPDANHIWVSPQKRVGLGHTRLSIIDLITGDQPLSNEKERVHLVVNGEFYGYEKIRRELEQEGHRFRTRSDSEIAIHLYEDLGPSCLEHLRGEFAFILWDENMQTCFAARDRFGIKPLFYTVFNQTLYLASEIKALFAAGVPARWDDESMALYAHTTLTLGHKTYFENIHQIPPGHYLLFKHGSLKLVKYWDFDYPDMHAPKKRMSSAEYIVELRSLLEEAVRIRLRADVPVGCYLSGGLDSSAVLGMAAQYSDKPISAFTLAFDRTEYDEEKIAKEMAENAGAIFHSIPIKQADMAANFVDAVVHAETFFSNGHGIAKYLLSRAVRDAGFKVVLTGEGADELFAGYPHFRVDQLLHGEKNLTKAKQQQALRNLRNSNSISLGFLLPHDEFASIDSVKNLLGYTPSWLLIAMQSAQLMSELLSENFKDKVDTCDGFALSLRHLDVEKQLKHREPVNQSLYLWSKFRLPGYILTLLGDRMEMAHSIEGRLPFLDHRVAEFMRDVPVNLKINGMTEKYLLREAARPLLTKTVYERQKHPFLAPPASLDTKAAFHDLLQTTLRSPMMAAVPFFNAKKIITLLDKLPTMDKKACLQWDPILMIVLSTCILQEKFHIST